MVDRLDSAETVGDALTALETSFGNASEVMAQFDAELQRMQVSMASANNSAGALSSSISRGVRRAFDGVVFDGVRLSDAMRTVAQSIVNATYSAAIRPITGQIGSILGRGITGLIGSAAGFADGGAFTQGRVMPFAQGGVVTSPTYFPMRGGTGLMGEAGPEAILPLARGADGRLGVRTQGGGRPVQVVMNINTPDVAGFQRSQGQIAAQMNRALGRGQRNR